MPPMPWAKWDDGERLGCRTSWRLWKSYVLPYRVGRFVGYDHATYELLTGPMKWQRPDILKRRKR